MKKLLLMVLAIAMASGAYAQKIVGLSSKARSGEASANLTYVNAVKKVQENIGVDAYNLGTGIGYSVLDVRSTFARVNDIDVPFEIDPRRPGDIATCYAATDKAFKELGWKAEKGLEEMCADAWNYIKNKK